MALPAQPSYVSLSSLVRAVSHENPRKMAEPRVHREWTDPLFKKSIYGIPLKWSDTGPSARSACNFWQQFIITQNKEQAEALWHARQMWTLSQSALAEQQQQSVAWSPDFQPLMSGPSWCNVFNSSGFRYV